MKLIYFILLAFLLPPGCKDPGPSSAGQMPIIDSHIHLTPNPESVARALKIFDRNGITKVCTKSAGFVGTPRFQSTLQVKKELGERFTFFVNLDWEGLDDPGWSQREAQRLEAAIRLGASGLKIFKNLGLSIRTQDGNLLKVDDPKLDPIFEKAAELNAIVAIHVGDPVAFFKPPTPDNERYLELLFAPGWSFYGKDYPSFEELMAAQSRLFARHPKTTFLGVHLAGNPEDLNYVDKLLDEHPNLYVDTSARVPEIGRHPPEKVRAFFIKHQDRILFGSDIVISDAHLQLGSLSIWPDDDTDADRFYRAHREYFETDHRKIDHPTPIQGDWKVDGINLPKDVLRKFYVENAEKLIWKSKLNR